MIPLTLENISKILNQFTALRLFTGKVENPQKALNLSWFYLGLLQSWFRKDHLVKDVICNVIFFTIPSVYMLFTFIWNLVTVRGDMEAIAENLSYTVVAMAATYNHYIILVLNGSLEKLTQDLRDLNRKYFSLERCYQVELCCQFVTNGLFFYVCFGCTLYSVIPYFSKSSCSTTGVVVCGLPSAGTFFYNASISPMYEITYLYQTYYAFISTLLLVAPTLFSLALTIHVVAHLDQIKKSLSAVWKIRDPKERMGSFNNIIMYHSAVLKLGTETTELSNSTMIFPVIASLQLSVLTFQLVLMATKSMDSKLDLNMIRVCLHAFGWIMITLLISFGSQILADKSYDVSTVAFYNTKWYYQNQEFQKGLLKLVIRAQRPLSFKVASIQKISLETFSRTMKAAYSFFNLFYSSRRHLN